MLGRAARRRATATGPGFSLHEEVGAARAYGCLLEFKEGGYYGAQAFVCDREFIADRCLAQLERMERQARERAERDARQREQALAAAGVDPDSEDADEKAQEELRRRERERERDEQVAARGANLDLGAKLAERFHRPKLTKDVARLLALLTFDRDADDYAARGLRYVEPKLQDVEVKELKSGKRKERSATPIAGGAPPTWSSGSSAPGRPRRSWEWCCRP